MSMSPLTLIVAATKSNAIGKNGGLPWRLPKEMAYFARVTSYAPEGSTNSVIMGRNTWESIPKKFRPLPRRVNVVVSSKESYNLGTTDPKAHVESNLEDAVKSCEGIDNSYRIFIIGGASLYRQSLDMKSFEGAPFVDRVLLTRIISDGFDECDVFIPNFLEEVTESGSAKWRRAGQDELQQWIDYDVPSGTQEENGIQYEFQMWTRLL